MSYFDPNSTNAMFAMIIARMDNHKTELGEHRAFLNEMRDEMRAEFQKLDGRIGALEQDRWYQRGIVAAIATAAVAAWELIRTKWLK